MTEAENDAVRAEAAALRQRRDHAYRRLPHAIRQAFDVECAERVLASYEARRPGDTRVRRLLELARASRESRPEIDQLRDEVYHAVIEALHGADDDDGRIAYHAAFAVYGASSPLHRGLANADYVPTSASEATNVRYIDTYVRTAKDSDAADVAVRDELRWQAKRAEELLRG